MARTPRTEKEFDDLIADIKADKSFKDSINLYCMGPELTSSRLARFIAILTEYEREIKQLTISGTTINDDHVTQLNDLSKAKKNIKITVIAKGEMDALPQNTIDAFPKATAGIHSKNTLPDLPKDTSEVLPQNTVKSHTIYGGYSIFSKTQIIDDYKPTSQNTSSAQAESIPSPKYVKVDRRSCTIS